MEKILTTVLLLNGVVIATVLLMTTTVPNLGTVLVIMKGSLQEAGKEKKGGIRTEIGIETEIEKEIEKEIGTRIVIVTIETATGTGVTEGNGVEIERLMIILAAAAEIMKGGGIMIEIEKTGIGTSLDLVQRVDRNTDQGHGRVHVRRAKGSVVLTWRLLLLLC